MTVNFVPHDGCTECQIKHAGEIEFYHTTDIEGVFCWNISEAKRLISLRPHAIFPIQDDITAALVLHTEVNAGHLDHIPIERLVEPGIIALIESKSGVCMSLIDGNHRAARALRDKVRFHAYVLQPEESESLRMNPLDVLGAAMYDDDMAVQIERKA